jgi:Zn-dependent protease
VGNIDPVRILEFLPGIILGLTVHEFCHALVALRCGDPTARDQGRITLNPLKHIDPIGFLMLIFAGFGWAKPVQFNEHNLRNPKADVIKIALAGPLSNAAIAMVLSVIFVLLFPLSHNALSPAMLIFQEIIWYGIFINWALFIFNLIPLPPLDGSHLLLSQFKKYPALYNGIYRYGSFLLLGLVIASMVTKIDFLPISPVIEFFVKGFLSILGYH